MNWFLLSAAKYEVAALRSTPQVLPSFGGRDALSSSGSSSAQAQWLLYSAVKGATPLPELLSCIYFALAKAFVLCSELIQLKNNAGEKKKKKDWLLVTWFSPAGAVWATERSECTGRDHGKRRARFSLPAAAAALVNTECKWLLNYRFSVWKYCPQEA